MDHNLEKAKLFIEALPYVQKIQGKTIVVKYGGNAMLNDELKEAVFNDIILMSLIGVKPVLVHGGGPDIADFLKKLDIPTKFINGLRVTDDAVMEAVEMVLMGKTNQGIVAHINKLGGHAIGLSGKDDFMMSCDKKYSEVTNSDGSVDVVDIGQVGKVAHVNTRLIQSLINDNYIPVIAPIGTDAEGRSYNINADYAAGDIAGALKASKLFLLTDVEGIFRDFNDKSSLISELKVSEVPELIESNVISTGMIPKVESCVNAINCGVERVHIIDGRQPHSILLELFTDMGIGTMIKPD